MRRLLIEISAIMLMLCSCAKEQETTYTLATEERIIEQIIGTYKDGGYGESDCDIIFVEYFGEQRVATQVIVEVSDDKEYTFVATPRTEFVTVRIDVNAKGHRAKEDFTKTVYIANVFYLTKEQDTRIVVNTKTITSNYEPK